MTRAVVLTLFCTAACHHSPGGGEVPPGCDDQPANGTCMVVGLPGGTVTAGEGITLTVPPGALPDGSHVTVVQEPVTAETMTQATDSGLALSHMLASQLRITIEPDVQPKAPFALTWQITERPLTANDTLLVSAAEGGDEEVYQVVRAHDGNVQADTLTAQLAPEDFVSTSGSQTVVTAATLAPPSALHFAPNTGSCPLATIRYPLDQITVTSGYGARMHPITHKLTGHKGLDLRAADGTDVHAAASGIVIEARPTPQLGKDGKGWGYTVVVQHLDGTRTRYAHLMAGSYKVSVGQMVTVGTVLASSDSSGGVTAPHLHVEYTDPSGKPIDPTSCITHCPDDQIDDPSCGCMPAGMSCCANTGGAPKITAPGEPCCPTHFMCEPGEYYHPANGLVPYEQCCIKLEYNPFNCVQPYVRALQAHQTGAIYDWNCNMPPTFDICVTTDYKLCQPLHP